MKRSCMIVQCDRLGLHFLLVSSLTTCLHESSDGRLCKQLGRKSGTTKHRTRSESELFDILMFSRNNFKGVNFGGTK